MLHDDINFNLVSYSVPLIDAAAKDFFLLDQFIDPGCWTLEDWRLLSGRYFLCALLKKLQTGYPLIVGCLLGTDPVSGEVGHLLKIVTHPGERRHGGANSLLQYYLAHLRSVGARSLYLEVAADNNQAIQFYRKSGLKDLRVKKKFYKNGEDALSMEVLLV